MNILLVESKAKCKTLLKHLGKDQWRVLPTGGHIERLAQDRSIHPPKEVRKAYWSNRSGELPKPPWFWTERGEDAIRAIKEEAALHDSVTFYLAADPDREGELIAWHLQKLLSGLGDLHRVSFQEITKPAVHNAVASPREVDQALVDAALIRMFMDRMVGWRASRIARRYTNTSTNSMGRVQTPTLGFIVERELEREAHVPVRYFEVNAATTVTDWRVRFHEKSDPDAWLDEKHRFSTYRTAQAPLAESSYAALVAAQRVEVSSVTRREKSQSARPPFSTDTLFQATGSRWGWSPNKTAALAGKLYELGHLTYIRTDSTRLANEAVEAGRSLISEVWGTKLLGAVTTAEAGAGVQDAHEAIRPTNFQLETVPDAEPDVQKLYDLVRAGTLASLMVPSQRVTLSLKGACEGLDLVLDGAVGWYAEPGWRRAFAALEDPIDTTPITVETGAIFEWEPGDAEHPNPVLREDATKPPARYRAHTIVRVMKEAGIGRPSTYAKTVDRLEERDYVKTEEGALVPTKGGRDIWLEAAPLFCLAGEREVFQTEYTAAMEMQLDDVAERRRDASEVWEIMRDEFKSAHAAAQEAGNAGPLVPRSRLKLQEFVAAAPELAAEVGDLDTLSEQDGRALLADLRTRGINLLPSEKQLSYLQQMLETVDLTLERAVESASLRLAGAEPNRDEASALIDHLSTLKSEGLTPSAKQLHLIAKLAEKAGLDEAGVSALVGLTSYAELTGGRGGTASAAIDALRAV
ncbi:MAG: DNA topoisomerase-1 [Candidatus Latescibacterota bacterium]|jgi:DNA topoisomerase-1